MARRPSVKCTAGYRGKLDLLLVPSFLLGCPSLLYLWGPLSLTNAVRTTELESDLMDHRRMFVGKQLRRKKKRGRTGPTLHCNISCKLLLAAAEILWLTDWLKGELIDWRFPTQILLDKEKFNNRVNCWLNFILSIRLQNHWTFFFFGVVT